MLLFKYWIEFDDDGEIKNCYKDKPESVKDCKEYIVKLVPIDRDRESLYSGKFKEDVYKLIDNMEKCKRRFKDLHKLLK